MHSALHTRQCALIVCHGCNSEMADRPRVPARWEVLDTVASCVKARLLHAYAHLVSARSAHVGVCLIDPQVPVIANGDVYTADDIDKMLHHTLPVSSCMLARGALKNTSVFSRQATPCVVPTSLASCCVGYHGCCAGFPLTMW